MAEEQLSDLFPPGSEDLVTLLEQVLDQEKALPEAYRIGIALAAALACRNQRILRRLLPLAPRPGILQDVTLAVTRMGITNPYFQVRQVAEIPVGGSLDALAMRPLAETGIADETAYHYYALAISSINQGLPCFRSHLTALMHGGATPQAVDQALRIAAAIHSLDQVSTLYGI